MAHIGWHCCNKGPLPLAIFLLLSQTALSTVCRASAKMNNFQRLNQVKELKICFFARCALASLRPLRCCHGYSMSYRPRLRGRAVIRGPSFCCSVSFLSRRFPPPTLSQLVGQSLGSQNLVRLTPQFGISIRWHNHALFRYFLGGGPYSGDPTRFFSLLVLPLSGVKGFFSRSACGLKN